MAEMLRFGMVGLDTSHATAFAELLHDTAHPQHVSGGRVVVAYPGGSSDFELSRTRVDGFTAELRERFGVAMVDTLAEVAETSDAILLESVDGRVHRTQFEQLVSYGKPIFVDKPFALSGSDAVAMLALAKTYGTPVLSCSALRFSQPLQAALGQTDGDEIIGVDTAGPMALEPTQPGLFWYGIHCAEMLFTVLGSDCRRVASVTNAQHDVVVGEWGDGRIGTIRGNRLGNTKFSCLVHRASHSSFIDVSGSETPFYASLLAEIVRFCRTGVPPVAPRDTLQLIRFIEAANRSRETGAWVALDHSGDEGA